MVGHMAWGMAYGRIDGLANMCTCAQMKLSGLKERGAIVGWSFLDSLFFLYIHCTGKETCTCSVLHSSLCMQWTRTRPLAWLLPEELMSWESQSKIRFVQLLCPDNMDTNFIAKFQQIMELWRKADEAVATPQLLSDNVPRTSLSLVLCDWRPPTKGTAKKRDCAIVVGPLVAFGRTTRKLTHW